VILQLDIGNSRVKWRQCDGISVRARGFVARAELYSLFDVGEPDGIPRQVWVSSVAGEHLEDELRQLLLKRWNLEPWFARSADVACGVRNSYAEPSRMGVDRWLAMLAAWADARREVCIVDAGSALTIDFVRASGQHLGGYILPGLDSMERALLQDTDRVRFSDAARDQFSPGISTEEAVYNGLFLSQAGAVALAMKHFGADCALYFTGGNGANLCRRLELGGNFVEDLVLDGLQLLAHEQLGLCAGDGP
jgi:type III pantothenate kinase